MPNDTTASTVALDAYRSPNSKTVVPCASGTVIRKIGTVRAATQALVRQYAASTRDPTPFTTKRANAGRNSTLNVELTTMFSRAADHTARKSAIAELSCHHASAVEPPRLKAVHTSGVVSSGTANHRTSRVGSW